MRIFTLVAVSVFVSEPAILQASMPNAVFNYLFAKQYDAEPDGVAGMVVVSTLLSFAALPLLLWYLL